MLKYTVLCVIYNKKCDMSETIKSLLSNSSHVFQGCFEINVWDNSTNNDISEYNKYYCNNNNIHYHGSRFNESLSKVYNIFLENKENDYLIILDDDTNVSKKYMEEVDFLANNIDFQVAVPKINSPEGYLYSPAKFGLVKGVHFIDIKSGYHNNLVAIASGVFINCISMRDNNISFDEKLSLYGIDTDFFLTLNRKKIKLYVMNIFVNHDLSYFNEEVNIVKRKRLINHLVSGLYLSKKRGLLYFMLFLIYLPLVIIKKYKIFIFD